MTRPRIVLVAVAVVVALGSCSGDDSPESAGGGGGQQTLPPTSATTEAPTTTPATLDEQEAAEEALDAELRAAYERYWDIFYELAAAPNPDDPRLPEVATGLTLTVLRDTLATDQAEGNTLVLAPEPSATSREILDVEWAGRGSPQDPDAVTEAFVEACMVDDSALLGPDGVVIQDHVSTARWELIFVREAGVWKVSQSDVFDEVEGVASCAEA